VARIGISITKSVAFRDSVQEFSNVYYYENGGSLPSSSGAGDLIDEVTALEKGRHSSSVTFVRGRCWSQVGSPGGNEMIHQKALVGNGSSTSDGGLDRERAFLIRWRAGNDSRGNAVYLRKWYHTCGQFGTASGTIASGVVGNTTGFTQTVRDAILNSANAFLSLVSAGGGWSLVAKNGRTRSGTGDAAHKYLEHRQLGDQWRG
jgi:hypothetical protein